MVRNSGPIWIELRIPDHLDTWHNVDLGPQPLAQMLVVVITMITIDELHKAMVRNSCPIWIDLHSRPSISSQPSSIHISCYKFTRSDCVNFSDGSQLGPHLDCASFQTIHKFTTFSALILLRVHESTRFKAFVMIPLNT